jgi:hypothetical protein
VRGRASPSLGHGRRDAGPHGTKSHARGARKGRGRAMYVCVYIYI